MTRDSLDLLELDATAQSRRLAEGTLRATDLMAATLDRIDAVNPEVNAVVSLRDRTELMAEAEAADRGPRKGWMHGLPIAVKDLADVAGLPTSMGSPLFADYVAPKDSGMAARFRAAGALFIGKTNTPEFGLGSHSFNPVHGATANAYDTSRSAGGSSGGAAVALAARMVSIADGSDMMGSLRNPAGWNNVYGFRPTWGLVPGDPRPKPERYLFRLATLGPMARSPADLAALLMTQAGRDPRLNSMHRLDHGSLSGLRVGWLGDWGGAYPMEAGILDLCGEALAAMSRAGARVRDLPAPFAAQTIWSAWTRLRHWEVATATGPLFADPEKRALLKPAAQWEVTQGQALSAQDIHDASVQRTAWAAAAETLFQDHDVLALPVAQVWPFDKTLVHPTEINGTEMDTYHRWMEVVVPVSLLGLPCVAIPAGFGASGLPMGLQVFGPPGSDVKVLQFAQAWHRLTAWPSQRP